MRAATTAGLLIAMAAAAIWTTPAQSQQTRLHAAYKEGRVGEPYRETIPDSSAVTCAEWRDIGLEDNIISAFTPSLELIKQKQQQLGDRFMPKMMTGLGLNDLDRHRILYRIRRKGEGLTVSVCRLSTMAADIAYLRENLFDLFEMGESAPIELPATFEIARIIPGKGIATLLPDHLKEGEMVIWHMHSQRQFIYLPVTE